MKPGQPSQTAVLVAAARAIAHDQALVPGFSDPTAFQLLPESEQARVIAYRQGRPRDLRGRTSHAVMKVRAAMMAVRTLFIDEALRERACGQIVILGAGLDGRAWRMPELRDAVVFEVDHPATQQEKRARVAALRPAAREVKFVPVDFTRDDLGRCLATAGHDATRTTTWIWEGVVMYLTPAEVDATLAHVRARSAPASRLILVYLQPGRLVLRIAAFFVKRLGEPFRSTFRPREMSALLARHELRVVRDEDVRAAAQRLAPSLENAAARLEYMRLAVADLA